MLLAFRAAHDVFAFGGESFDTAMGLWFQPVVFLASGLVIVAVARQERLAWSLIGSGLVLYGLGSVVYNLFLAADPTPSFPSISDGLWLALYPFAGAGIVLLMRSRLSGVGRSIWLDGAIGAAVIAALTAALLFESIFDLTTAGGAAGIARFAYPLGDLACLGFVIVVWSLRGRDTEPYWLMLGAAFGLLAVGDSVYVVQAATGTWAPGNLLDFPYAVATMLVAGAACAARRTSRPQRAEPSVRLVLPVVSALAALGLIVYGTLVTLNPLATTLAFATLFAVVLRFGISLASLDRQSRDLAVLAATDPLTGLPHHRTLHEHLGREISRARRSGGVLSAIVVDVDRFKAINDHVGHAEGDRILQEIAAVLDEHLRPYDHAARAGGDEFTLLLPEADGHEATAIAERCRTALSAITTSDGPLSCSAGVATFPTNAAQGEELLKMADAALYAAKRLGGAQVRRFDPAEHTLLSETEQYEEILAVLADETAITPYFQPIVEVATGRIGGYEALSRFLGTTPVRPPDQWFAQARRCGLGNRLEARAIAASLTAPGRPAGTFLSLNVSPAGLLSPEVKSVLPRDLSDIVIELTEDELFAQGEELDLAIDELRGRGARIAVDDAGAGYAGLQELIRIKPDILKIDRSLIQGIHADGAKIALLESLSRFAVTTGAAVCGEGIEEADELRVLSRLDVTYAQGFALGRPGPAWPATAGDVASVAISPAMAGMRVALPVKDSSVTLGDVTEALGCLRSGADVEAVMALVERVTFSDEVALSRILPGQGGLETLSRHDWGPTGETYRFGDYPTTERVVADQLFGQIIDGDEIADPAETQLLRDAGFGAVLMAPIVLRGDTVGLLELYRRAPRPWTPLEVDRVRMLAHQMGPSLWLLDNGPAAAAQSPAFVRR